MKITDYHRDLTARYYASLVRRFGLKSTLRFIPRLKPRVWSESGIKLMENRL